MQILSFLKPHFRYYDAPRGATRTHCEWWTQGHQVFRFVASEIFTWATQPGMIWPPTCVEVAHYAIGRLFCGFPDVLDVLLRSSSLQIPRTPRTRCRDGPAKLLHPTSWLTVSLPPIPPALSYQGSILGYFNFWASSIRCSLGSSQL